MKNLILLRHGKSTHNEIGITDFERKLSSRGIHDASLMKVELNNNFPKPDLIICSASYRTKQTCDIFFPGNSCSDIITYNENLYLAPEQTIDSIISATHQTINTLLLIGHNPGFTEYANRFANILNVPTCGLILVELEIDDWSQIYAANGTVRKFEYPKKR